MALAVMVVLVAGCDSKGDTATTDGVVSPEDVVFSQGEMPETIPADFPLPTGAVIGSTMVVTKTGFTEMVVRISAEQGITVEYFNQALPQAGFTVDRSQADGDAWVIEFSDDDAAGTIDVSSPQETISQAVVRYNVP